MAQAHSKLSKPDLPDIKHRPPLIALRMDGAGKAVRVDPETIRPTAAKSGKGFVWVHLKGDDKAARDWLQATDLDRHIVDSLIAEETRPRFSLHGDGVQLNLRGVNLNPGAEPEDMISIRLWIEGHRIISVWMRPLFAVQDMFEAMTRAPAPFTPGELVAQLCLRLADRAEPTVAALNESIDDLEDAALDGGAPVSRRQLSEIRRTSIVLRRYMFPQRDALTSFEIEELDWIQPVDRNRIREAADRVTRLAEELDAIRDRAQIVHEQIMDQRAEAMNRQMLVLTVVAAVFLPLGLITGLLGINVGGIPGENVPWAFWAVAAILVVIGLVEAWFFRRFMLDKT